MNDTEPHCSALLQREDKKSLCSSKWLPPLSYGTVKKQNQTLNISTRLHSGHPNQNYSLKKLSFCLYVCVCARWTYRVCVWHGAMDPGSTYSGLHHHHHHHQHSSVNLTESTGQNKFTSENHNIIPQWC